LRLPPFQPTLIFYDGIFGCFTKFFSSKTSKFRHSVTKKRQLDPLPGLCPWTPLGDFRPPDPLGPLLSHILNTPLSVFVRLVGTVPVWFHTSVVAEV